jgi:hypothetical protein
MPRPSGTLAEMESYVITAPPYSGNQPQPAIWLFACEIHIAVAQEIPDDVRNSAASRRVGVFQSESAGLSYRGKRNGGLCHLLTTLLNKEKTSGIG